MVLIIHCIITFIWVISNDLVIEILLKPIIRASVSFRITLLFTLYWIITEQSVLLFD
jgi:hypothetical protein